MLKDQKAEKETKTKNVFDQLMLIPSKSEMMDDDEEEYTGDIESPKEEVQEQNDKKSQAKVDAILKQFNQSEDQMFEEVVNTMQESVKEGNQTDVQMFMLYGHQKEVYHNNMRSVMQLVYQKIPKNMAIIMINRFIKEYIQWCDDMPLLSDRLGAIIAPFIALDPDIF